MEFVVSIIFQLLYNIRPQDWFPGLAGTQVIKPVIAVWLMALVAARSRPSPLPGLLKTPHDWAMLAYLGYIVVYGDAAVMSVLPLLAFYALTVQSVNTWPRLLLYLKCWIWSLVVVAAFGALVPFGIDLTGARASAYTEMGRLALGTWLHDNPNALCHSIVPALAALYLLYFQKAPVLSRFFLFPALASVVVFCAWQTQSKGGYLVGAGVCFLAFALGKPRWLQAILVAMALAGGISVLSFLPRMSEMGNLSADEGVMGRILAWEQARAVEEGNPTGVGWQRFIAMIPWQEGRLFLVVPKATHSSYVQVGADLGRYGLFLYLAPIWCALHTLIFFKAGDVGQERCRRILLVFIAGYLVSGWLINRQYHTEYFLLVAVSAALHRLKKGDDRAATEAAEKAREEALGPDPQRRRVEEPIPARLRRAWESRPAPPWNREDNPAFKPMERLGSKPFWNRFGLVDLGACLFMTWLTFRLWDHFMKMV